MTLDKDHSSDINLYPAISLIQPSPIAASILFNNPPAISGQSLANIFSSAASSHPIAPALRAHPLIFPTH